MTGCALVLCYGLELREKGRAASRRQVAAWLLMGLGALAVILQLAPVGQVMFGKVINKGDIAPVGNVTHFLVGISNAWAANTQPADFTPAANLLQSALPAALLSASMILMLSVVLSTDKNPRLAFLLSLAWIAYVEIFKYMLSFRHFVIEAQITLFVLWIGYDSKRDAGAFAPVGIINLLLFYSCILTPFEYLREYRMPFSAARDVAAFLKRNHLESRTIVVDALYSIRAFLPGSTCLWAPYIGRCQTGPMSYDVAFLSYLYNDVFAGDSSAVSRAAAHFHDLSGKVFVLSNPLPAAAIREYHLALAYYERAQGDESGWVYMPAADFWSLPKPLNRESEGLRF
jgi:hypothetical protein